MPSLPLARPRTYVDGDPLIPDDINALFDGEIGGKRGSKPLVIPASSFIKISGAATLTAGQWLGVGVFLAVLPLFVGTTIDLIKWGRDRANFGTLTLSIVETAPIALAFSAVLRSLPALSSGSGYGVSTFTAADVIAAGAAQPLAADTGWAIQVEHTNSVNALGGVRIDTSVL